MWNKITEFWTRLKAEVLSDTIYLLFVGISFWLMATILKLPLYRIFKPIINLVSPRKKYYKKWYKKPYYRSYNRPYYRRYNKGRRYRY